MNKTHSLTSLRSFVLLLAFMHLALPAFADPTVFDPDAACTDWRYIAVKAPSERFCPSPGVNLWTVSPLFASTQTPYIPPGLREFCVYEHSGNPTSNPTDALITNGKLLAADKDCASVATMGTISESTWGVLKVHFLDQAGYVDRDPSDPATLALLDTAADTRGVPDPGSSPHGYSLTHLAEEMLCENGCRADLATRLALPIIRFDHEDASKTAVNKIEGGYFGTFFDLAKAIREEAVYNDLSGNNRFILNLSLAWDGGLFGGLKEDFPQDMSVGVQAIYRSLQYAGCLGGLTVASAGNRQTASQENPMLPAAWESHDALGTLQCQGFLGKLPPVTLPLNHSAPLLYAVGGVTSTGDMLSNARQSATPPRVAYGDHAVTDDFAFQPTTIYTGSSVAAAVVSATAAAVWNERPNLLAHEVMAILDAGGDALAYTADFYYGESVPGVRRISMCNALAEACQGGACVPQPPPCQWTQEPPDLSLALSEYEGDVVLNLSDMVADVDLTDCTAETMFFDPAFPTPEATCPFDELSGILQHPWTGPQPEEMPCPSCPGSQKETQGTLQSGFFKQQAIVCTNTSDPYTLHIEIEDDYQGGDLSNAILRIGEKSYHLAGLGVMGLGDTADIHCLPGDEISNNEVVLSFLAEEHGAIGMPVMITH